MDIAGLRQSLTNKEETLRMAEAFAHFGAKEAGAREEFQHAVAHLAKNNIEFIYAAAGSPIELMFFNSMVMYAIKNSPTTLWVTPPTDDTSRAISRLGEWSRDAARFCSEYDAKFPDGDYGHFKEILRASIGHHELPDEFFSAVTRERLFEYSKQWTIIPQARFPDIRVNGKSIRADAVIWCPAVPDKKLAIECDGFDYHSDKPTFTSDRQRDRALQSHGFEVQRYSGSEIYADPSVVVSDVFEWIFHHSIEESE